MDQVKETGKRINPYKLFTGCWVPEWLAIRPEISQGAKLAYGRLCRYAGKDGKCNPRIKTLAYEIGVKKRQASEYLAELKDCKLIEAERNGRGKSNWYYFLSHNWMNSYDTQDSATQKGVDMQDSASLNMQDTATQKAFDMQDSASPYKESQYLRESEEESKPASAQIAKILKGIPPPPVFEELFKINGFFAKWVDYWHMRKLTYSQWPNEQTVYGCLEELKKLNDSGQDPIAVMKQSIYKGNKALYEVKNFEKNGKQPKPDDPDQVHLKNRAYKEL